MPLYEYTCQDCQARFEEIHSASSTEDVKCSKCHGNRVSRLISRFAISGQGDLRESTMHGCHEAHVSTPMEGGHVHGPGCSHSSPPPAKTTPKD